MKIITVKDPDEKRAIARTVLDSLTEWFEIEESREHYIADSAEWTFLAALGADRAGLQRA